MDRITIIPFIQGKITRDGKMSEPDIHWIMEKWLERHPEIEKRTQDIRVTRGTITLAQGIKTDLIRATIVKMAAEPSPHGRRWLCSTGLAGLARLL